MTLSPAWASIGLTLATAALGALGAWYAMRFRVDDLERRRKATDERLSALESAHTQSTRDALTMMLAERDRADARYVTVAEHAKLLADIRARLERIENHLLGAA